MSYNITLADDEDEESDNSDHNGILKENSSPVHDQKTQACFAMTAATLLREAEKHIFGRIPQKHSKLVKLIID